LRRALIALLLVAGCATTPTSDVRDTHNRRFAAMLQNDVEALKPMLADDLLYIHSAAELETREQFLERLRSGSLRYLAIDPSETMVRTYGTVALVTGRAKVRVTSGGADRDIDLRYTSVYRLTGNEWQLVSWQSTRVP
jgi:ketosteroid isomerase-like protein